MVAKTVFLFLFAKKMSLALLTVAVKGFAAITDAGIFFVRVKKMPATFGTFRVERSAMITQSSFLFLGIEQVVATIFTVCHVRNLISATFTSFDLIWLPH